MLIRAAFLIAGTTIGAGMLGLPLVTAEYGFPIAALITCLVYLFMLITGLLLLEVSLKMPEEANFLTLAKTHLGTNGFYVTGITLGFFYYFYMVVYIAVSGILLGDFLTYFFDIKLSASLLLAVVVSFFGLITIIGPKSITRVNLAFILGLLCVIALLIIVSFKSLQMDKLLHMQKGGVYLAFPILFSAFGYHTIIPSLVTYMKKEARLLRKALIIGTLIPLIIYLFWQALVIGVVPLPFLHEAYAQGLPATTPLIHVVNHAPIAALSNLFALFAIFTSILGVAFAFVDLLRDGLGSQSKAANRPLLTILVFLPPFIMTLWDPAIFDEALGIAGGIGASIINGIIPVLLFWSLKKDRSFPQKGGLTILLLGSFSVVLIELYKICFKI